MQYPTILEYVKAIQDAGNNLDKLAHLTPVLDDHGEPYHMSGAFAVVFKMQDKSTGKCYALKCFLKDQKECADDACYQIDDEQNMVGAYSHSTSVKYMDFLIQGNVKKIPVLLADWLEEKSMETFLSMNEDMTTEATDELCIEVITDEYGVEYGKDGKKNPPDSFLVCYRAGSLVVFFYFPIIYRSFIGREIATYLEDFPVVCCIF